MRKLTTVCHSLAALLACLIGASSARADQPQLITLNQDIVRKGATPTIVITLDKSIPDQGDIKTVKICGQPINVQPPSADGKLAVQLPELDLVGQCDVNVIGKNNATVATVKLTYVGSADVSPLPQDTSRKQLGLLLLYVALIVLLPFICTIYDIRKSYSERTSVLKKLPEHPSVDDIKGLFVNMDQGPTGLTGLTRGLLALTLVLALAIVAFHLIVFRPTPIPDVADKLIMLLAGTLTSISGFYFGSKAVADATQQQPSSGGTNTASSAKPTISSLQWDPAAKKLAVIGQGFGVKGAQSAVMIGNTAATVADTDWIDTQIVAALPSAVPGSANVTVTNGAGVSSDPKQVTIS